MSLILSSLPFADQLSVPGFIACTPDVNKPERLKISNYQITEKWTFIDHELPATDRIFFENKTIPFSYFINLHNEVPSHGGHNYRGARIPLAHNSINVETFRA